MGEKKGRGVGWGGCWEMLVGILVLCKLKKVQHVGVLRSRSKPPLTDWSLHEQSATSSSVVGVAAEF